jgi:hypothetical protein
MKSIEDLPAEYHFVLEEYAEKLGISPPMTLLIKLPVRLGIALLTQAIICGKPLDPECYPIHQIHEVPGYV